MALAILAATPSAFAQTGSAVISDDWAQRGAGPTAREQAVRDVAREDQSDSAGNGAPKRAGAYRKGYGKHGEIYRTERSDKIDAAFKAAETPGCLSQDAMKHSPPKVGPVGFGGVLALPFLAAAAVKGKCK